MKLRKFMGCLCFLFFLGSCRAQTQLVLTKIKYVGYSYKQSANKNFVTKELLFFKNADTLRINVRLPFDSKNRSINDDGLFYWCQLKSDSVYSFTLRRTTSSEIPTQWDSYYKSNADFNGDQRFSKFKEIRKDTEFNFKGNYGKFVDFNGELFEIISLLPATGCQM